MMITDEMVERALNATTEELPEGVQYALIRGLKAMGWEIAITGSHDVMRAALTAALEGREEPDAPTAGYQVRLCGPEGIWSRWRETNAETFERGDINTVLGKVEVRAVYTHPSPTDIARIRAEAVAEERERCARVAEVTTNYDDALQRSAGALPCGQRIAAAIRGGDDAERYRHLKCGTTYRLVGQAKVQTDQPLTDMDEVTVYRCEQTGDLWARRRNEFEDGRFERVGGVNDQR